MLMLMMRMMMMMMSVWVRLRYDASFPPPGCLHTARGGGSEAERCFSGRLLLRNLC